MNNSGIFVCACLFLLKFFVSAGYSETTSLSSVPYPTSNIDIGEELNPNEADDARRLAEDLANKIQRDYHRGGARRDAHPKAHGCVNAKFNVLADMPAGLQAGVFATLGSYDAIIRFSNGSPNATGDDSSGDTRGMAVKIFEAPGEKLFADPAYPSAQDFVLISSPYFFVNGSAGYTEFFRIVNNGGLLSLFKIPFILGLGGTINAGKMLSQKIDNPLNVTYYSVTPYQLGDAPQKQVVKYSTQPCEPLAEVQAAESPNFLRHAMQDHLRAGSACFMFRVQPRPDDSYSIEDVISEWPEDEAPFIDVARIEIAAQEFDTAAQNNACENMSYNPWHSVEAHRPLGTVNRMRRLVYQIISELRFEMNDVSLQERQVAR
jgi:catalase